MGRGNENGHPVTAHAMHLSDQWSSCLAQGLKADSTALQQRLDGMTSLFAFVQAPLRQVALHDELGRTVRSLNV